MTLDSNRWEIMSFIKPRHFTSSSSIHDYFQVFLLASDGNGLRTLFIPKQMFMTSSFKYDITVCLTNKHVWSKSPRVSCCSFKRKQKTEDKSLLCLDFILSSVESLVSLLQQKIGRKGRKGCTRYVTFSFLSQHHYILIKKSQKIKIEMGDP